MSATPDSVIRTWFEEVWNQGKESTIDRLFARWDRPWLAQRGRFTDARTGRLQAVLPKLSRRLS